MVVAFIHFIIFFLEDEGIRNFCNESELPRLVLGRENNAHQIYVYGTFYIRTFYLYA